MKKRILSMILAIAMVVSVFAGITIIANASGSYVKATSIAVGDNVVLYCETAGMELTAISTTSTKYGIGTAADANALTGTMAFVVEAGATEGTYAFKSEAGYLYWKSGNSLAVDANLSANTSWTVSFDENGNAIIYNAADAARLIRWNKSSPRFACYTGKETDAGYYAPQIFKLDADACAHENATSDVTAPSCTEAGVEVFTCSCGATWEVAIPATGHNYVEGEVITPATCTTDGEGTVVCANEGCGDTQTQVIKATGHDFVDGKCTVCYEEEVILEFEKLNTIVAGVELFIVTETSANEMVSIGAKGSYGDGASYAETGMTAAYLLKVEAGASEGTYAFKAGEKYLAWKSSNSLILSETLDANSSWKVSFDEEANVAMINAADETRQLFWNNTSPRFACYAGKTVSNQYHAIQFYAIYTGDCRHLNATSEITAPANCTESGIMTWTCECGETWTTEIPATGHTFTIAVVEGVATLVCECGYSEAVVLNTIAEAKAYTDKTVVYSIKGVVTYVNGRNVYIQDENDALCVYFASGFDTSAINLGDEIFVSSTMTDYKGLLELNAPEAYYVLSTGNALPNNATVTVAELLADTTNAYLGERVTIEGLTVGVVNEGSATTLTDASGNSIALFKAAGLSEIAEAGDTVTVTAIVSTYNGYQLIVNPGTIATDVIVTAKGGETEVKTVPIAEAKAGNAGEYYQVEGVVTTMSADKRTIYIQDATGGIALYLNAKPTEAVCAIGDMVKGFGAFKAYNGLIELEGINAADTKFFEILSSGNAVEAQVATIADLMADSTNEYLSEKIAIEGAVITAIASNGTVTLEQNGATINIYKAPALAEGCTVGATVNVTAVVSAYNGYQLLINEAADVVFVKACEHASVTVLEGTAATCTTEGLTEGAQCAICGTITVAQEVIPATGHTETVIANNDGTHTIGCANCDVATTEDCAYVEGACSVCGAADPNYTPAPIEVSMKIGHSLNLASDISINFAAQASALAAYTEYYMECILPVYEGNTLVGTRSIKIDPVINGSYCYFTLTGITAVNMNDIIEARIYMTDGVKNYVSTVDMYSVGTYAYAQMDKAANKISLKNLCADLLRYGAAAQTYKGYRTDALVDAKMTDAHKAYLSDIDAVKFNDNKGNQQDYTNNGVTWKGCGIDLNSKVLIKFIFQLTDTSINVDDLSAVMTFKNYKGETVTQTIETAEVYNADKGFYSFTFDGLLAAELRSVVSAVIYNGETRISSSYIYSIDTYGNGKTGNMLALCKSLIAYSDTALAYFNG